MHYIKQTRSRVERKLPDFEAQGMRSSAVAPEKEACQIEHRRSRTANIKSVLQAHTSRLHQRVDRSLKHGSKVPSARSSRKVVKVNQIFWIECQICAIGELSHKENVGWPLRSDDDGMNSEKEKGKGYKREERKGK
ncbi:hypothetical protein SLEP1_g14641 [Rubroshorea leprosula]|uniref:Uncharacterized protein n=1 Tax=Rubroshorea leprosula TaxID=152421 RepID=A0AAV5IJV2_9ROSI|nr:hypothetical protein SLEP1_g14641 [Rubroshorea leprosula]